MPLIFRFCAPETRVLSSPPPLPHEPIHLIMQQPCSAAGRVFTVDSSTLGFVVVISMSCSVKYQYQHIAPRAFIGALVWSPGLSLALRSRRVPKGAY